MNNQSIKFLSVTIQNFRGIPDRLSIPLDAPLTVIHAPNGTGKSTICYALEWLLRGKVEDLSNVDDYSCQWGSEKTFVSAECYIGNDLHEISRQDGKVKISKNGGRKKRIKETELLELLTPAYVSGQTPQAVRKAKSGWLRNSRWLYSNSLSLLVDNNKAEERQQIFADILGLGHLTTTLRELRDYRKQLPSTKGLKDRVQKLDAEIINLKSKLAQNSPLKSVAKDNLSKLLSAFPVKQLTGKLSKDFKLVQYQVNAFDLKVKSKREILVFLSENWTQYHAFQAQLNKLRQTLSELTDKKAQLNKEQSEHSANLSAAQVKEAEGKRAVAWAQECWSVLEKWEQLIEEPSIAEYRPLQNITKEQLEQRFVELSWNSGRQQEWFQSLNYLNEHSKTVLELVEQKQEIAKGVPTLPTNLTNLSRLVDEAKSERIEAETEFNSISSLLEKLKTLGQEVVHSHRDQHCPLCNYDWKSSSSLLKQIESNLKLAPKLNIASNKLNNARKVEEEHLKALSLANSQKSSHEAYLAQIRAIDERLNSIAQHTKYLEVMNLPDFSSFNIENLIYLQNRIKAAMNLKRIFEVLSEVEGLFNRKNLGNQEYRISAARKNIMEYIDHYQAQETESSLEEHKLTLLLNENIEKTKANSREINEVNANLSSTLKIVKQFEDKWHALMGETPVEQDSLKSMENAVQKESSRIATYTEMLAESKAIANIDLDSERLNSIKHEKEELAKKLEAGNEYIADADRTIEQYSQHVMRATNFSLDPLLKPAAELFSRMHANEVYNGLSVSNDDQAMKWTVFAEGSDHPLDAEEKFSQGQRQDLALSLYLARAINTGGSFFLDEPIAHLDDLNRVAMLDIFRLAASSIPNINLILTTASDGLARHMAQKFSNISDRHLLNMIYLKGNPRKGVTASITRNTDASAIEN